MDFISGNYFKKRCRYKIGHYNSAHSHEFSFKVDDSIDNDYVFCKTEYLGRVVSAIMQQDYEIVLPKKFVLFTHNSDNEIYDASYMLKSLPGLRHWYAQNLNSSNPLVSPIPIGLANPKWEHGNTNRFRKIIAEPIYKHNMVHANFNVATKPDERNYCLSQTGHSIKTQYPDFTNPVEHNNFTEETQGKYLRDMKASYFVLSPNGNGIDCHKTWEAIYMKSVPIVTQSVMVDKFKELGIPLLIINDWSEFNSLELTPDLYHDIWNNFDITSLNFALFTKEL